jgi:hypothetical protein
MTVRKTGAEHIKSLQDGRTVLIDGKHVADASTPDIRAERFPTRR